MFQLIKINIKINSGFDSNNRPIKLLEQKQPGLQNGIFMVLFSDFVDNLKEAFLNFDFSYGPKLSIDNQSYISTYRENSIPIKTGTCTYLSLKKVFTQNLPSPYSNCKNVNSQTDTIFYNEFTKLNKSYEQRICFDMCLQYIIIKQCNCYSLEIIQIDTHLKFCSENDALNFNCSFYITNEKERFSEECSKLW